MEKRITPACAGKTKEVKQKVTYEKDHPRVCGENSQCHRLHTQGRGSPPRVRGKLMVLVEHKHGGRITPACAGKTMSSRSA